MGARETALNVLIACRKDAAWSNGILKEYIHRDRLDSRDAGLAARLCYGVQQNRQLLDHYLKQLLTGKVKDLHPAVRDILHLGLYQIYWMDKIPTSAAVNESVTLAKKYCKRQRFAPGLVNAVLRAGVRTKGTLQEPTAWEDKYSHPKALIELLAECIPAEKLERMLAANNTVPPLTVQVNTLATTVQALSEELEAEGVAVAAHPWLQDALIVSGTGDLEKLESFRKGFFYVQDAASRHSVLCAQLPSDRDAQILDCCSAPGGKSFAAAIAMGDKGKILSCDVHPHKAELIRKGAQRLGLRSVEALCQDATLDRKDWHQKMDAVIADVPCSGFGIIRKKPDIRNKDIRETALLPALQLQILSKQADYVKPGGVLMYSTCTVLKRENEDVVAAFLQNHKEFFMEKLTLPPVFPEDDTGMLTLLPGEYDTDGFFICRLRRKA